MDVATTDRDPSANLSGILNLTTSNDPILLALTARASDLCRSEAAGVATRRSDRMHFLTSHGIPTDRTPHIGALVDEIPPAEGLRVIEDTGRDRTLAASPLFAQPRGFRFVAAAPLLDTEGVQVGTLCVFDVRPRTLTEAQGRSLLLLAGQVAQRLTTLRLEADLIAARTQAERTATEATRLSGVVREAEHRLGALFERLAGTPLRALTTCARLLLCEASRGADSATTARLTELVKELRRLSVGFPNLLEQLERGSGFLLPEVSAFSLRDLLDDLRQGVEATAAGRGIAISFTLTAPVDILRNDPRRLHTVLGALLDRALLATPVGGAVSLRISGDEEHLRFEVRDGGPGMPRAEVERLFDPQLPERDDRPLTPEERAQLSERLSLSLGRYHARLIGGDVFAASAPGLGTLITLAMPANIG